MSEFKEVQKQIFWYALIMIQSISMVYKVNVSLQLMVNSIAIIALGALYSIRIDNGKRVNAENQFSETITIFQAIKFPLLASGLLLMIYALLMHVDKSILIFLLKIKFGILGMRIIGKFLIRRVHFLFPNIPDSQLCNKNVSILNREFPVHLTSHKIIAYLISATVSFLYIKNGHWSLNNIIAIGIAINTIANVRISKFSTAVVLLLLLVIYDVVWVFCSDVMMVVAQYLDVPIKLILPVASNRLTHIGLGDIIIPGLLACLALKFDVDVSYKKFGEINSKISTPSFYGVLGGYAVGIVSAFIGMSMMNQAQPALLYLVPMCTLGLLYALFIENRLGIAKYYESEAAPVIRSK